MTARRTFLFLPATVLLFCGSALALTGTVADTEGKPIQGARVCYYVAGAEPLCVETDPAGYFDLPDSRVDRIRVFAQGYLPRILPAVEQAKPIELRKSATLRIRVVDATTGEAIGEVDGEVAFTSGRQRRFLANRAGARVRTLTPGRATVTAGAAGYLRSSPQRVDLVAGEEVEVEIRLLREEAVSDSSSQKDN